MKTPRLNGILIVSQRALIFEISVADFIVYKFGTNFANICQVFKQNKFLEK